MAHYTKLWNLILESTVWQSTNDFRVLWITLLAKKEQDHIVRSTIPKLADDCHITNERCEEFLEKLMSPDKYSGSPEFEGRRLRKVEGGWLVLNGQKYQDWLKVEHRKAAINKAVKKHRGKKKAQQNGVPWLGDVPKDQQSEERMQRDLKTTEAMRRETT
jgi:hypothetical protein